MTTALPLVFSAAAATAGWFIGGTTGASIGWSLGSALYNATRTTELPAVFGPQLSDLTFTTSAFGQMVPFGYGTFPVPGNIIWATNWRQHATTTVVDNSGGKGGGGGTTQTQVTYYYDADFAVLVHDGAITGIRKIWVNGKLYRDAGDDSSVDSVLASPTDITIYTGSETQTPDSTIETAEGTGNVPAWRGYAYVVFTNFRRENFGSFRFEVVANGATTGMTPNTLYTLPGADKFSNTYGTGDQDQVRRNTPMANYLWTMLDVSGNPRKIGLFDNYSQTLLLSNSGTGNMIIVGVGLNSRCWYSEYGVGLKAITLTGEVHRVAIPGFSSLDSAGNDRMVDCYELPSTSQENTPSLYILSDMPTPSVWSIYKTAVNLTVDGSAPTYAQISTGRSLNSFLDSADRIADRLYIAGSNTGGMVGYIDLTTDAVTIIKTYSQDNTPKGLVGFDGYVYVKSCDTGAANVIEKLSSAGALIDSVTITALSSSDYGAATRMVQDDQGNLYVEVQNSSGLACNVYRITYGTMDLAESAALANNTDWIMPTNTFEGKGVITVRVESGGGAANNVVRAIDAFGRVASTAPALSTIVTDVASKVSVAASEIDVTAITGVTVPGFVITNRGSARSVLEPLMAVNSVDAVESDDKVKFVVRGGATAVTIAEDNLAVHEYDVGDIPDPVASVRKHELELPLAVDVAYLDKAFDYQINTQRSSRLITSSKLVATLRVPMVLTANKAKQVADIQLYSAWVEQESVEFFTDRTYSKYEPTDVFGVTQNGVTRTIRVTEKGEGANGILAWKGIDEDAPVYTQTSTGGAAATGSISVSPLGPTIATLLDTHLVRNADDDPGFYFAAKGAAAGWIGAVLNQSVDDGVNYSALTNGTLLTACGIGRALTALAAISTDQVDVFDEDSSVSIYIPGYTLSSYTAAVIMAGTATGYLLKNELFYAKTATLTAADTYLLSGLLRGRRGTESYTDEHAIGDKFAVIDSNTRSIPQEWDDVDVQLLYKPVSVGSSLDKTASFAFTNTARRKKPLAPCLLKAGQYNAAGDILIEWTRRTRYDAVWRDGADAALGETIEEYVLNIYAADGTTILRSVTATSPSYIYVVANQTADFGTAPLVFKAEVRQKSSEFGQGYSSGVETLVIDGPIFCQITGITVAGSHFEVSEIAVFEEGVDRTSLATKSSSSAPGDLSLLFDGNLTTRTSWTAAVANAADFYVRFQFPSTRRINGVKMGGYDTADRYPTTFTLSYSFNQTIWSVVGSKTGLTYPGNNTLSSLYSF